MSTSEIIHPELYFDKKRPAKINSPKIPQASRYAEASEGELGELDIYILLKQFVDEETADKLSPQWRAGHYRVMERKADRVPLLAFSLQFASTASAGEFVRLYREKVLPAKTKRSGRQTVQQKGTRVSVLEGLE